MSSFRRGGCKMIFRGNAADASVSSDHAMDRTVQEWGQDAAANSPMDAEFSLRLTIGGGLGYWVASLRERGPLPCWDSAWKCRGCA